MSALHDEHTLVEAMEEIERKLIQSVKTSGVKKQREVAMVDQLLELRKHRRKYSADKTRQLSIMIEEKKSLSCQLERALTDLRRHAEESEVLHREESGKIELKYRQKLEEYSSKRDAAIKKYISNLKEKHSTQISILESKLRQISDEYSSRVSDSVVSKQSKRIAQQQEVLEEQESQIKRLKWKLFFVFSLYVFHHIENILGLKTRSWLLVNVRMIWTLPLLEREIDDIEWKKTCGKFILYVTSV